MARAWWAILGGLIAAPVVTWLPMLKLAHPRLPLPLYPPAQGIDLWEMQTLYFTIAILIALMIGSSDRWLAAAVGLAGFTVFWRGAALDPTHSLMFILGALSLLMVRVAGIPAWARRAILGVAAFEAAYVVQQLAGWDLLWIGLPRHAGWWHVGAVQPYGTFGSVNATAGYLAVAAPLMPWLALPVIGAIILGTHSLGAMAAFAAGIAWRYRQRPVTWVLSVAGIAAAAWHYHKYTQVVRVQIWGFALKDWAQTDPVLGYGLGGWAHRIPTLQIQQQFFPTREVWAEAHNEPLQWLCETGLVGLVLLGLWLVEHRAMFTHALWGPSLVALGVDSLSWHPFHIVGMALMGVMLVGLATPANGRAIHV